MEFFTMVSKNKRDHPTWRYGQTLFNTLLEMQPERAEKIRGTNVDPFNSNKQEDYDRFFRYVFPDWP